MTDQLALTITRAKVRHQIKSCTACPLHTQCTRPVPAHIPPSPSPPYAILGEAPGKSEDHQGRPFVGAAGRQMRRMMRQAGLLPEEAAWLNCVCCDPHGTPDPPHILACDDNLTAQLDAVNTRWIVTAGKVALETLVPDVQLKYVHGAVLKARDHLIFPVWHPAFVLREPTARGEVVDALRRFAVLMNVGDAGWLLGTHCGLCGQQAEHWADDGVPLCWKHKGEVVKRRRKYVLRDKRMRRSKNRANQLSLELS